MSTPSLNQGSAFTASRLTPTTFLVKEYNDIYDEKPHIYVKIVKEEKVIMIIDTGCGGAMKGPALSHDGSEGAGGTVTSLRTFIETVPVDDNGGHPLNIRGENSYLVVLTHCHYDHILAVEDFPSSPILVSGHDPAFLSPSALPEHTLCKRLNLSVPKYTPTMVPHLYEIFGMNRDRSGGKARVSVLHTPGHTPDELALYDWVDGMLYVGDSLYEEEPVIFPKEGSIVTWFSSMQFLIQFTKERNAERQRSGLGQTLVNAGHCTALKPALEVIESAVSFIRDVVDGKEKVRRKSQVAGLLVVEYKQDSGRFSLRCPMVLIDEAN
ncbi:hypothetical protein CVT24_006701 [Panaeolus cyanescens]|uniref:Metallo-beta-lactamase domain-containing protein n=1 Tax=Panaeolus cyanescens TaxID=181874 RepID=A0A409X187_9AGAR|nr:hypothetical protein CVT24_006701 [Panaeolus cyanescens]